MTKPKTRKSVIFLFIIISILIFVSFNQNIYNFVNSNIEILLTYTNENPAISKIIFFVSYILLTSLSLPVALMLGLLSGILFDTYDALLIVSFASSIGATIAFLLSRYVFRSYIKNKYLDQYNKIHSGFIAYGGYYLFALRMSPIFPYFIINFVFGLTSMRIYLFYVITQIGMLPMTFLIILFGGQVHKTIVTETIINFDMAILLSLIGILPLISKMILSKYIR